MLDELFKRIKAEFPPRSRPPEITLRSGDAADSGDDPIPFDTVVDVPTDEYLKKYYAGIRYLNSASWNDYLPFLMEYSLRHYADGSSLIIDTFLQTLRLPDGEPRRWTSLSQNQKTLMLDFLLFLSTIKDTAWQELATDVLRERGGK